MKKACLLMMIIFVALCGNAQLLKTTPEIVQDNTTNIDVVLDASYGNKKLFNYTSTGDVYVYIGLITSASADQTKWQYVKYQWTAYPVTDRLCTSLGNNKWKFTITGGLRTFFGVTNASEKILKIAIIFRNGAGTVQQGNSDGSDPFIPVFDNGNVVRITDPFRQFTYVQTPEPTTKIAGNPISVSAASTMTSDLKLFFNGTQIGGQTATTTLTGSATISSGTQTIIAEATNASAATLGLIENLQREGLNPMEEAMGFASLVRDFDLTQETAATRVGKSRASVANALRLLSLDGEIQGYLSKGLLSTGHAKVILGVEDASHRLILARRVISEGLSVRATEKLASSVKGQGAKGAPSKKKGVTAADAAAVDGIQRRLTSHLGARVALLHTPKKGRIVIEYRGNQDLQRILEKIGIEA